MRVISPIIGCVFHPNFIATKWGGIFSLGVKWVDWPFCLASFQCTGVLRGVLHKAYALMFTIREADIPCMKTMWVLNISCKLFYITSRILSFERKEMLNLRDSLPSRCWNPSIIYYMHSNTIRKWLADGMPSTQLHYHHISSKNASSCITNMLFGQLHVYLYRANLNVFL